MRCETITTSRICQVFSYKVINSYKITSIRRNSSLAVHNQAPIVLFTLRLGTKLLKSFITLMSKSKLFKFNDLNKRNSMKVYGKKWY